MGFTGKLILFLIIVFGLSYMLDVIVAGTEQVSVRGILLTLRMFIPLLGVLVVVYVSKLSVKDALSSYGLRRGKLRYIPLAILIPFIIYGFSVLYALFLGYPIVNPITKIMEQSSTKPPVDPQTLFIITLVSSAITGATVNAFVAFGEEIGWRGFLLTEFSRYFNVYVSSIIIGVIWGLWHAPLILLTGYNYPHHPDIVGVGMFILLCIVWSMILSILRILGNTIIAPSIMHGTMNALGNLMLFTIDLEDEIYTAPVGVIGFISSLTILLLLILLVKLLGIELRV